MNPGHAIESPQWQPHRAFSAVVQRGALADSSSPRSTGVASPVDAPHALSSWGALVLSAYAEQKARAAGDPGPELAARLSALRSIDRTWIVLYWALSPRKGLRLAVARAAPHLPLGVGLRSALHSLAHDGDRAVRSAATRSLRRCAWTRSNEAARSAHTSCA